MNQKPKEKFTPVCECVCLSSGALKKCSLCSASGAMYEALLLAKKYLTEYFSEYPDYDETEDKIDKALALVESGK